MLWNMERGGGPRKSSPAVFLRHDRRGRELDSWESNEAIRYSIMISLPRRGSRPTGPPAQMFHSQGTERTSSGGQNGFDNIAVINCAESGCSRNLAGAIFNYLLVRRLSRRCEISCRSIWMRDQTYDFPLRQQNALTLMGIVTEVR